MPNEEKMTLNERWKCLRLMRRRYLKGSKPERGRLLDEMEVMTGLHRKSLITGHVCQRHDHFALQSSVIPGIVRCPRAVAAMRLIRRATTVPERGVGEPRAETTGRR